MGCEAKAIRAQKYPQIFENNNFKPELKNRLNVAKKKVLEKENSNRDRRAEFVNLDIHGLPTTQDDPDQFEGCNVNNQIAEVVTVANNNDNKQTSGENLQEVDIIKTQEFCQFFKIECWPHGRFMTTRIIGKVNIDKVANNKQENSILKEGQAEFVHLDIPACQPLEIIWIMF